PGRGGEGSRRLDRGAGGAAVGEGRARVARGPGGARDQLVAAAAGQRALDRGGEELRLGAAAGLLGGELERRRPEVHLLVGGQERAVERPARAAPRVRRDVDAGSLRHAEVRVAALAGERERPLPGAELLGDRRALTATRVIDPLLLLHVERHADAPQLGRIAELRLDGLRADRRAGAVVIGVTAG